MGRRTRHDLHQAAGANRRADFRVPRALLASNRHRIALRDSFAADIAREEIVVGQREAFFQLVPQLPGDSRLNAEIPPVLVECIARQLRLLIFRPAGHQICPFAAGGVVHIPVHQLAYPGHFRPGGQRRIEILWRFIDPEGEILSQTLSGNHRVEPALLHQRTENRFCFVVTPALQQQIRLPIAPLIFLFRFHRQARQPGIQPVAVPGAQRHSHPALY